MGDDCSRCEGVPAPKMSLNSHSHNGFSRPRMRFVFDRKAASPRQCLKEDCRLVLGSEKKIDFFQLFGKHTYKQTLKLSRQGLTLDLQVFENDVE